jgi:hypothetical protein
MAQATLANNALPMFLYGIALCSPVGANAEAENVDTLPDMDFLEYLGMWEESDEEWLLLEEEEVAGHDQRSDPAPEGEASTETDDES